MAIAATLSRRNTIATSVIPPKLTLPSSDHFHSFPLDLHIFQTTTSYTSLRDILPSTVPNSPTPTAAGTNSGYQIVIRNRLVKQAAWAYFQPMSTSPDSGPRSCFCRAWINFSNFLLNNCVSRAVTRSFHRLLEAVRDW